MKKFFTYIIESQKSGRYYYGHSQDVISRLDQHNGGKNKSTRGKGPWALVFIREFESRSEANRFELELKRIRNKKYIRSEFARYFL